MRPPASANRPGRCGSYAAPALSAAAAITSGRFEVALVDARGDVLDAASGEFDAGADNDTELRARLTRSLQTVMPARRRASLLGIGLAIPGVCDTERGVILGSGQVRGLRGQRAGESLSRRFDQRVLIDNDARAQALGEKWFGEGRGVAVVRIDPDRPRPRRRARARRRRLPRRAGRGRRARPHRGRPRRRALPLWAGRLLGDRRQPALVAARGAAASLARARPRSTPRHLVAAAADLARQPTRCSTSTPITSPSAWPTSCSCSTPPLLILHGDVVGGGEDLRAASSVAVRGRVLPYLRDDVRVVLSELDQQAGLARRRCPGVVRDLQVGELMRTRCRLRPGHDHARGAGRARRLRRPHRAGRRASTTTSRSAPSSSKPTSAASAFSCSTSSACRATRRPRSAAAVAADLGIDPTGVLPACIHTHSGPSAITGSEALGWVIPPDYTDIARRRRRRAAAGDATAAAEPASLHFARGQLPDGLSINRRGLPYDPWFAALSARRRRRLDRRHHRQPRRPPGEPGTDVAGSVGRLCGSVPDRAQKPAPAATRCLLQAGLGDVNPPDRAMGQRRASGIRRHRRARPGRGRRRGPAAQERATARGR